LNALLTAIKSIEGTREVNYTSIENYPLDNKTISSLNLMSLQRKWQGIFHLIIYHHGIQDVNICKNFNLHKMEADFTKEKLPGV